MTARLHRFGLAALACWLAACSREGVPLGPDLIQSDELGAVVYVVNGFDGTANVTPFTFGPAGSIPALASVAGVDGGQAQGVTVTAPAAGGYAGGFGYTRLGGFPTDDGTTLNLYLRPDAGDTFTLGIRIQDDDNGDGQILRGAGDAIVADDEFGYDLVVRPGAELQRVASIPISALTDLNAGVGNGVFDPQLPAQGGNGGFVSIAFILLNTTANAGLDFVIDEVTFNSDEPASTEPSLTAEAASLTFQARAGQASATQTVTVGYANLTAPPTVTASAGFTAALSGQTGTLASGSQTYTVTFTGAAAAGTTTGTLTFASSGETATVALTGTTTAGAGTTFVYRTFEDAAFGNVGLFSQTNNGVGVASTTGAPASGGQTALRFSLNPAQAGAFAGFVVPPQAPPPFSATGAGFFSFYLRTSATTANTPLTLEINFHEDADANGAFNGAVDDEFQATYSVQPGADWRLVTLPLSQFTDDNAVFPGASNGFNYARLFEIVFAIGGPTGAAYTVDVDDIRFTEFTP